MTDVDYLILFVKELDWLILIFVTKLVHTSQKKKKTETVASASIQSQLPRSPTLHHSPSIPRADSCLFLCIPVDREKS